MLEHGEPIDFSHDDVEMFASLAREIGIIVGGRISTSRPTVHQHTIRVRVRIRVRC